MHRTLAEKTPTRPMEEWESNLLLKSWKAYSRARGYTEAEIKEFQELLDLKKIGKKLGFTIDDMAGYMHEVQRRNGLWWQMNSDGSLTKWSPPKKRRSARRARGKVTKSSGKGRLTRMGTGVRLLHHNNLKRKSRNRFC